MSAHCIKILIALALFLAAAPSRPVERQPMPGIKGADDRVLVAGNDYPWSAIGRVNNTLGPFCTGTLVGPRLVLTAAHCLWNKRTGTWLPACALHFLAAYQRGAYLAHSLVASYELASGEGAANPRTPPGLAGDWAVLTLAKDLGAIAGSIPTAPLAPALLRSYRQAGGLFLQAGYSRDRAHILTMHDNCRLSGFAANNRLVLHECDATFGDSGSPILLRRGNRYSLIAIHVATDERKGKGIALTGAAFHQRVQSIEPAPLLDQEFKACQTGQAVPTIADSQAY